MSVNEKQLRELLSQIINEVFQNHLRPIEKKMDELEKKMNQLHSKIEGVQFLTKEEIVTLRRDLKAAVKK